MKLFGELATNANENCRIGAVLAARRSPARVLAIVGSSHEAYVDAYPDMMHEVALVDAAKALPVTPRRG